MNDDNHPSLYNKMCTYERDKAMFFIIAHHLLNIELNLLFFIYIV